MADMLGLTVRRMEPRVVRFGTCVQSMCRKPLCTCFFCIAHGAICTTSIANLRIKHLLLPTIGATKDPYLPPIAGECYEQNACVLVEPGGSMSRGYARSDFGQGNVLLRRC